MKKEFKRRGKFYVYIVECRDGVYYTGYTNNLEKRIKEHNCGRRGAKYLRGRLPVKLVWTKEFRYYKSAVRKEHVIKKLNHRKKEELARIYERARKAM